MSRDRFLDRHHRYFPLDTIHWIQVDSLMRSQPLGEKAVQDLKNQNISIWWNQRNGQVLWFHFHTTKNVHFDSKWLWVVSILSFINLESEMDLLVKHRDYLERPVRAHLLNDIQADQSLPIWILWSFIRPIEQLTNSFQWLDQGFRPLWCLKRLWSFKIWDSKDFKLNWV